MRGAHLLESRVPEHAGIIPADAGSTVLSGSNFSLSEDHPRGCGEHALGKVGDIASKGSSPRMRGARVRHSPSHATMGIIPADAGSTPCAVSGLP